MLRKEVFVKLFFAAIIVYSRTWREWKKGALTPREKECVLTDWFNGV